MKIYIYICCLFFSIQSFCQDKWQQKNNSFKLNYGVFLQKTDSNGWYVATNTKTFTPGDRNEVLITHYNKCGNVSWSFRYTSDSASITMSDLISDNEENLVMTGSFSSADKSISNVRSFIMKLSSNGNIIWKKVFNLAGIEYVYSIGQTNDGAYFIFSNHDNVGGALPYNAITKVSHDGNLIWYRQYADNPIWGAAIKTTDGGILIRSGNLIYKINSGGSVLWSNSYNNIEYTSKPLEVNGQYIFASYPSSADSICYLFSITSTGNLNWISPSFKSTAIKSIKRLSNGNLLTIGSIQQNLSSLSKICITEFNVNGGLIQQQIIDASPQQLSCFGSDFIELDNQSLICAAFERSGLNDSLILLKSRKLTDLSCAQSTSLATFLQKQINLTTIGINSINIMNQAYVPSISKIAVNLKLTTNCFIPDNNTLNLGNDTLLCQHQKLILKTALGNTYQYIWSTGETSASITVDHAGTYWVKAYLCDTISDTIVVDYVTPLSLNYTISPLITNPYTQVKFENFTHPYSQLIWQTGDGKTYTSDIFQHQYVNGGIYYPVITITDQYNCVYSSQSKIIVDEVTFYVPNSFSPNGDGSNDIFIPKCTGVQRYEMFIYNRWGEEIYKAVSQGWNGKLKGNEEAMQGIYNYKIILKDIFGKESIRSGAVTLFR
ncbi:MAG: gliding motility-associated C-terminal domain-containing protein [Bacteroidales bacterium]